jgi:hypothetical protein
MAFVAGAAVGLIERRGAPLGEPAAAPLAGAAVAAALARPEAAGSRFAVASPPPALVAAPAPTAPSGPVIDGALGRGQPSQALSRRALSADRIFRSCARRPDLQLPVLVPGDPTASCSRPGELKLR